jgi:hypothetical protein
VTHTGIQVAERHPRRLATPACLEQLAVEREKPKEGFARPRGGLAFEAGAEAERAHGDDEHGGIIPGRAG